MADAVMLGLRLDPPPSENLREQTDYARTHCAGCGFPRLPCPRCWLCVRYGETLDSEGFCTMFGGGRG